MNISSSGGVAFGKLIVSNDCETKRTFNALIRDRKTLDAVNESLNEMYEVSGDTDVFLSAERDKSSVDTHYNLYLNKGDKNWKNAHVCISGQFGNCWLSEHVPRAFSTLNAKCKKVFDDLNNKIDNKDFDEFYAEFGTKHNEGGSKSVLVSEDYATDDVLREIILDKTQLKTVKETLNEIEKISDGYPIVISAKDYITNRCNKDRQYILYANESNPAWQGVSRIIDLDTRNKESLKCRVQDGFNLLKKDCASKISFIKNQISESDINSIFTKYGAN